MDPDNTQEAERRLELDTGTGHVSDDDEVQVPSERRDSRGDDASREEVECLQQMAWRCVCGGVGGEAMHDKKYE